MVRTEARPAPGAERRRNARQTPATSNQPRPPPVRRHEHHLLRAHSNMRPLKLTAKISAPLLTLICYTLTVGPLRPPLHTTADAQLLHGADSAPQEYHQHNNILKFSVDENKPNNTYVGTIRSADDQVPYLVLPSPQTPERELKQAFNVNFTTGELTTNSILDREHRDQYHFIAIVKEPFAEIKCTIEVKDVNDNAPKFLTPNPNETNIVIDMPEGQRGIRQVLPLAFDFDSPQYGIKEFRIISGNTPSGTFQLVEHEAPARSTLNQNGYLGSMADDSSMLASDNPQLKKQLDQEATVLIPSQPVQQLTGAIQSQSSSAMRSFLVDLEASQPLDRENQSSYQLVVEAIDGGQPPQFGRLMVTVNVQDINDNDPVFHRKFYECHLSEDTPKGALVHRVQAYDVDLDSNGQVSYYLKRHTSSSQQAANSSSSDYSNSNNNEVVTNRFVTNANSAKQRVAQSQATQTTNKSSGGSQRSANIDNQDTLGYKARSSSLSSDQLFDIDPNKGEIYLVNQLDYETDQVHELLVEARDHGKPPRSSYTTVKVHVIDVHDDPPPVIRPQDERRQPGSGGGSLASAGDSGKAESSARSGADFVEPLSQAPLSLGNLNFAANWFSQMNSSALFVIVLVALLAVTFPVCLVKIKSRQPESDYNDTAGLTMASNNGQTKPSPSHSASNIEHPSGMLNNSLHHHHHDHQRRPPNLGSGGSFGTQNGMKIGRYQFTDSSSNHYHNPYPAQQRARHHSSTSHHHLLPDSPADHHQMPPGVGLLPGMSSRGGTMTLSHNHHHHHLLNHTPPGHHHSLDHHGHQFAGANLATGSLTYAHSHAALLHQAHHHRSSHQLSPMHHHQLNGSHLNKGGTMNSIGTHNSAHHPPSGSPMPATPNTIHSSVMPSANMHDSLGHHGHRNPTLLPSIPQSGQVPPTPPHQLNPGSVFAWPPPQGPGSTIGCYPDGPHIGGLHDTPGSMESCSSPAGGATTPQLDRWFDLGVPQLVNTQGWCGSYDWDYLENWLPEHHTLVQHIQPEATSTGY